MLVALVPFLPTLSLTTTTLLMVGGGLYSVGILFHQWSRLPYQNEIWHTHVLAAASCHFGAILEGLVLR
jgi:hemolysin III